MFTWKEKTVTTTVPAPEPVVVTAAPAKQYGADIDSILKFINQNTIVDAYNYDFPRREVTTFKLHSPYSITSRLTIEFWDKVITLETTHSTIGYSDKRVSGSIKVYRKGASPQLDLFKEVEASSLVGSINSDDVCPEQYNELTSLMGKAVMKFALERKQRNITHVLSIFEE